MLSLLSFNDDRNLSRMRVKKRGARESRREDGRVLQVRPPLLYINVSHVDSRLVCQIIEEIVACRRAERQRRQLACVLINSKVQHGRGSPVENGLKAPPTRLGNHF